MADIPMGPLRWLAVTSPEGIKGVELVLELINFPPARDYQQALFAAGMPALALTTSDIQADYERLTAAGVVFLGEPRNMRPVPGGRADSAGRRAGLFNADAHLWLSSDWSNPRLKASLDSIFRRCCRGPTRAKMLYRISKLHQN